MNITLLVLLFATAANASELRMSKAQALALGYRPVKQRLFKRKAAPTLPEKHSLPWPVEFQSAAFTIGNSMAQYQDYSGSPYWHGGDDLRTARAAWVKAPVDGTLGGGHYSYVDNADGSAVKHMLPWPQTGGAMYFEVSVTTDDGHRYELHHVDRNTLTPEVLKLLNQGGGRIKAGTRVGQVIHWPMQKPEGTTYHHIHYNIITPDEKELNPEWYSTLLKDSTPPSIHGIYAKYGTRFEKIREGEKLTRRPDEIVVASTDVKDGNSYTQPTDYIAVVAGDATTVLWDLRMRMLKPDGKFPDIREVFQSSLRTTDESLRTRGDYDGDFFLARVKLPAAMNGDVELVLKDQADNTTRFRLGLP